ncbi:methyltransferase domain-containing protein [Phosphitispora fastidiosa]|uniref:methyltransferase domain-containing protein n=1 Tax=Phosphitispora fastidiosa TaxID=2837202 RepID=UPI001E633B41|nr:methyltransferase domain-containing protein [Phosphitispora fastidiosa]MBU7006872.1 trans-aconitate 2-methyltransferase [Phosphitispora fastidiosa]
MVWNPDSYLKFKAERFQPFNDLINMITVNPGMKVIDLGCGTGELTRKILDMIPDGKVLGIDSSVEMLAQSVQFACPGLDFELRSIENATGSWDLVFSHSAIQWVDSHEELIPKLLSLLNPNGQLALQIPSCENYLSHGLVADVAREEPFRTILKQWFRVSPVLSINQYATILHDFGCQKITVIEKVYPHILENIDALTDWVSGTVLLPYFECLPQQIHNTFVQRYRVKARQYCPSGEVFYPFRRILIAAAI